MSLHGRSPSAPVRSPIITQERFYDYLLTFRHTDLTPKHTFCMFLSTAWLLVLRTRLQCLLQRHRHTSVPLTLVRGTTCAHISSTESIRVEVVPQGPSSSNGRGECYLKFWEETTSVCSAMGHCCRAHAMRPMRVLAAMKCKRP